MTLLARGQYAMAVGHGVALPSLNNIENQLSQQNRRVSGGKLYPVAISSPALDSFPVRAPLRSGRERGDGFVNTEWNMTLATYALRYLLVNYFSSGTVVSVAATIYTRLHALDTYGRYNAYAILPSPEAGDLTFVRRGVFQVRLRFNKLEAL